MKYNVITPKEAYISRQIIPLGMGVENEEEMKQQLRLMYDKLFEKVMDSVNENQPEVLEVIPETEDNDILKQKVLEYCSMKSLTEREAYTTESLVAKKAMGTNRSLNIDAFPIYYDILHKALS